MERFKRKTEVGSELYARSPDGLWVKSVLTNDGIDLLWQIRHKVVGNTVSYLDPNLIVFKDSNTADLSLAGTWRSAGVIPIDDKFVSVCGNVLFEEAISAVMRHSAHMVATGYGDDASDIVMLFSKFEEFGFMDGVSYRFLDVEGLFHGFAGKEVAVFENGEDDFDPSHMDVVTLDDDTRSTLFTLKYNFDKVSFLISTIPI